MRRICQLFIVEPVRYRRSTAHYEKWSCWSKAPGTTTRREGDKVRLFTRRGYDWRKRYPAIARTAALRCTSFTIDGEAVVCGPDGVAIFDALHRRHRQRGYAIRLHGEDLRGLPLGDRKKRLVYCGPVLRHPAEFMLPAVDLGGRVWLVASPVKAGPRPPPSAADGLDRTCHPTIVATKNSTARNG
jgi:hypothetical protein